MSSRLVRSAALIAVAALLLFHAKTGVSAALANLGYVALLQNLVDRDAVKGAPHLAEPIADTIRAAQDRFSSALEVEPGLPAALRGSFAAAILAGEDERALGILPELGPAERLRNPLTNLEAIGVASRLGDHETVLRLVEQKPEIEDYKAVAEYLTVAFIERGGLDDFSRARAIHPGDLYATHKLHRSQLDAGDLAAAAESTEQLTHFPASAIAVSDSRLVSYVTQVIPALIEEGLWSIETGKAVASYLAWQHPEVPAVAELLEELALRDPGDSVWQEMAAELARRQSLAPDPTASEPANSTLFGHPADLLVHPEFALPSQSMPQEWLLADYADGRSWPAGACAAGVDPLDAPTGRAARVTCFWLKTDPALEPARYGLWLRPGTDEAGATDAFAAGEKLAVIVTYRTRGIEDGDARVYVEGLVTPFERLPASEHAWSTFSASHTAFASASLQPLLTLWSAGDLWIDRVAVVPTEE